MRTDSDDAVGEAAGGATRSVATVDGTSDARAPVAGSQPP